MSLTDHGPAVAAGDLLYGEASFGGGQASNALPATKGNGANVYIRPKSGRKNLGVAHDTFPGPVFPIKLAGFNPWILMEFDYDIEIKQVVVVPMTRDSVKNVKVYAGRTKPELSPGQLYLSGDPKCGEYTPPVPKQVSDYFKLHNQEFSFEGKVI